MATKKQQRRRQKERRHDYEYVWVDEEGNELEAPPEESKPGKMAASSAKKGQPPRSKSGRPLREIKPPSWPRVARRALLLGPLLVVALSLGRHPMPIVNRVLIAVLYTVLFVPMFYWIDRMAYRRYLRTTGQADPPPRAPKR